MSHSLDLLFLKPIKEKLSFTPIANIYVKANTRDKEGRIVITRNCLSLREIEAEADRLITELKDIKKKAKQNFIKLKS